MISDGSDEDADSLDDDDLVETYLVAEVAKADAAKRGMGVDSPPQVEDWPSSDGLDPWSDFGANSLAWFKANHSEWRLAIQGVLRGWVMARAQAPLSDAEAERRDRLQ